MDGSQERTAWKKQRDQLAKIPGVKTVPRSLPNGRTLPLASVRSGPQGATPILVLPGGPGLASVLPYRLLRARAAKRGLDVLMVEHRGVGMSRKTDDGSDLEPSDLTVAAVLADLVAVLDAERIEQVIVYGSSYGSYLAGAFGTQYPTRVAGMILDSAMLDAESQHLANKQLNELYWQGTPATADHAERVRTLVANGTLAADTAGFPLQFLHEFGGPEAVAAMLALRVRGKGARTWAWIKKLGAADVMQSRPFLMEFDLVARIAFTELGYGARPDSAYGPLTTDDTFAALVDRYPPFEAEPCDIREALPRFDWPTLVISGDRDIRTPRETAEEIIARAPRAELLPVRSHGHSALDTAHPVALDAMQHLAGPRTTGPQPSLDNLTAPPSIIGRLLAFRLNLSRYLPSRLS